jgi:phosphotransferase system enzyme I (PtsP)
MTAAAEEITRLSQRVSDLIGQDNGAILQAQLLMLQDRTIEHDLTDCLKAGQTAEEALHHTLDKYVALFQGTITGYLQERIQDVKDVFRRIHWHLRPRPAASSAGRRLVLIGPEASVMDLFSVDLDNLAAVVVESGGVHSHAAILARSLGIPMVGQVPGALRHLQTGQKLDVDGSAGMVYLDPPAEAGVLPPVTNGERPGPKAQTSEVFSLGGPHLEANINLLSEVQQAIAWQVAGVGLFRSEFLFLARRTLPTEEEQVGLYRKLLARLGGRPASLRTFDLRPDKLPHGRSLTSSSDGPLDWRRVLGSPLVQKLFKEQVRAILRAAARGPARLLVPLVLCTEQLDWILGTLEEARKELQGEGLEYCPKVPLGIMIEVAGVVPLVEAWADYVDFFTLGTNDLVSSALGIPRDDSGSNPAHDPLHPGVLRLIREATTAARRAGKPVTVCGEMAADPAGATVLAAFQVDALSVAVNQLPATRSVLNALPHQVPEDLVPSFLSLRTAAEVRRLLRDWTRELFVQHDHFISNL